jgi:ABC-type uncharacterized transport system involved in gliding motility auxiliary subunit
MTNSNKKSGFNLTSLLWIAAGVLMIGLLFARAIYPEILALTVLVAVPLLVVLGILVKENQKALKSRTAAYGLNSAITVLLVLGIIGVLDFITSRYPYKIDLTKNKTHTLSDQTVKLVKGLQKPVKATFFSTSQQREQFRGLFDNYKNLNPKFEVEFVNPDREPTRTRQAGIRKPGTLQLMVGARDTKIEDINEEKITNSLIKLLKDKSPTLCVTTGHGEKNFAGQEAEGYSVVKKALNDQAYEVKDLNLIQESKIPESCDALAIMGATKAFFEPEVKLIKNYLDNGGRALVAVDINLKGGEFAPELFPVLQEWHIKPMTAMIVDPFSRLLGADASISLLSTFSKENPITQDFQANCLLPFTRPLEVIPGAPAGMNVKWLAQTNPKSFAVTNLQELAKGEARFVPGKDKMGPLNAAIVVEGKQKDSKATKNTRLVVFGSSFFATNNFSRFVGNLDFFLNSVSWVMEDESLISIRAKEDTAGKVELSQKSGTFIFLLTVVLIPLVIAACGLGIWIIRRRL